MAEEPPDKSAENSKLFCNVDWSKVLTNAVSALIATTFVGAAAIVWQAAIRQPEAIREKVEQAKKELQTTQQTIIATQDNFSEQIANITLQLDALRDELRQFAEATPQSTTGPDATPSTAPGDEKKWFHDKGSVDPSAVLTEKTRILNNLEQQLNATRERTEQFDPRLQMAPRKAPE